MSNLHQQVLLWHKYSPLLELSLQKVKIIKLFYHFRMFACMFLQLHGDKGVDYCLSDFVFFFFLYALLPLEERCTHWWAQLSWARPVWHSVAFHNKIYETHRDECHLLHHRYLRFHLSKMQGVTPSTLQYLQ